MKPTALKSAPSPSYVQVKHNPRVLFVGDAITAAWLTPAVLAAHPNWINGSTRNEDGTYGTSGQVLAKMPGLLTANHPDVVEIMAGSYDAFTPGWDPFCGIDQADPSDILPTTTCGNLQSMIQLALNAGITHILLGMVPPLGPGKAANTILAANPNAATNVLEMDDNMREIITSSQDPDAGVWHQVTIVDYEDQLQGLGTGPEGLPGWATGLSKDGVTPDAAGGKVMTQIVEGAIVACGCGAPR